MQLLITSWVLIIGFISPCLCMRWNFGTKSIATYNVMDFGAHADAKSDDSLAFSRAWESTCETNGTATLIIPSNTVFMVTNITLKGPCSASDIHIQLLGKLVAPAMDAMLSVRSQWIMIQHVNGLTIDGGGLIDGYGSTWWSSCKTDCERPTALGFHACNELTVSNLNIINSPRAHISINGCEGATFSQINIHAPDDSPNTDGFDISASKNILIESSIIGTGDDCIAINGGSSYINVTGVACGPGHGISVGSLGRNSSHDDTVEEVYVSKCTFNGTQNGARIKTIPGGSGYARNITFEQIQLIGTRNPIFIDQNYDSNNTEPKDEAVKVSDVTYRGFGGTSIGDIAINLNCSSLGCFNIVLDDINIVSSELGNKKTCSSFCKNAHGTVGSTIPNVSCLLP